MPGIGTKRNQEVALPLIVDPRRSQLGQDRGHRLWLRLCCALVAIGWWVLVGCGGPIPWSVTPPADNACDLRAKLRDLKAYQEPSAYDDPSQQASYAQTPLLRSPYRALFADKRELGCLVLAEAIDTFAPLEQQAIALTDDGKVTAFNEASGQYNASPQWSLSPGALKDKNLALTLYILRQGAFDQKDHTKVCADLIKQKPDCFSSDPEKQKGQACWFFVQLQPKTPEDSPFKFKSITGESCRICSRELCGNKIDDDCDGQVDEGCDDTSCHHPGKERGCYTGPKDTQDQGICGAGKQSCQLRKETDPAGAKQYAWDSCIEQRLPKPEETCNGVDDNCNGQTDEGLADCCLVGSRRACSQQGGCSATQEICTFAADTGQGAWKGCSASTPPKTDICNGIDDDCDGMIDEDYPGGLCSTGLPGDCAKGEEICMGKQGPKCLPVTKPGIEQCDGIDNDCNGQIDDFFAQRGQRCTVAGANGPCAVGIWVDCVNGKPRCEAITKPTQEICGDGVDNDCDGKIDKDDSNCQCNPGDTGKCYPPADKSTLGKGTCAEGTQTCQADGKWGSCENAIVPGIETCNGKDDNCDGNIDEDFPEKGTICNTFAMGPCAHGRLQKCGTVAQGYTPQCVPLFQAAPTEICHNGIDDDCNGLVDESSAGCDCRVTSQSTQACSQAPSSLSGIGECKRGQMTCGPTGVWSGCTGDLDPVEEVCDGKDNDCNGMIDERDPNAGKPCQVNGQKGVCLAGKQTCVNQALKCTSIVQPATSDLCNGLDDDCDGQTDEDDPAIGKPCAAAGKTGACSVGTLSCQSGKWQCDASTASKAEECNGLDDDCNGTIDDKLLAPPCDATPKPGICATATKLCGGQLGWLECQPGDYFRNDNSYQRVESTCDGKDNDCDGKVDNQPDGRALSRPCYQTADGKDGPAKTQDVGTCKAGQQVCNAGSWGACADAVLPKQLDCAGNLDADCNGRLDKDEPGCGCWGSGRDGSITIKTLIALDQVKASDIERTPTSQRPRPDIVTMQAQRIDKNVLTLQQKPDGLTVGDEILLIHMQGESKRLGQFALHQITQIDAQTSTLTLSQAVDKIYGATDNNDLKDQTVLVLRVPHYKRVTIAPGGHLTVTPWNGNSGGILVFRAQEVVRIDAGGTLSAGGVGYRGGTGVKGNTGTARAGEGGSSWPNDQTGKDGGGSAAANSEQAASGGGGGYSTKGQDGRDALEQSSAPGGVVYGPADGDLRGTLLLGAGGGGGGADSSTKGNTDANQSGQGGSGGGIVFVIAHTLNLTGRLHADGNAGQPGAGIDGRIGGGGGGAGGSIALQASQLILYQGASLSAAGGDGGKGIAGATSGATPLPTAQGGKGSTGRLDLQIRTLNGTTQPTASALATWTPLTPTLHELNSICQ